MKKLVSALLAAAMVTGLSAGTAFADYGYTSVSEIPMAADFSVRVDFDGDGQPHVVTDYPFESAGASEMNLVYAAKENPEVFTLKYTPATGATAVGSWNSDVFGDARPAEEAYRMIRNGEVSTDGCVYISTSNYGLETDWVLVYSVPEKNYTEYKERTYAQAFNAMGNGGTEKAVYYRGGKIESARLLKRIRDVLIDSHRIEQIEVLKDHSYPVSFLQKFSLGKLKDIRSSELDRSAVGSLESVNASCKR